MRDLLYKEIVARLKAITIVDNEYIINTENTSPAIQHFGIWNEQLQNIEAEIPFYTPAIFIEFMPINWTALGNNVKDSVVQIVLHTLTDIDYSTSTDTIDAFAIENAIQLCLEGFKSDNIGGFTLEESITDTNFAEIMHNKERYAVYIKNNTATLKRITIDKPTIQINV
ncbi:MAG TPA: hypothetical protein P5243_09015 [Bacteroidales bacterium]|jgi:hypothetical protein|nr:hypothetical protein [Bacteroidales bacterium]HRS19633.1 hypothetical protein [Bacteroidales bacterium]